MDWEVWLILCAILIVGEIFTASFFAGPLGAGCLVAALIANATDGDSLAMQFLGFSVTSIDGDTYTLSDFVGERPFILYFFATW